MPEQIQERINIRMKGLDDVFHNVMIALERLETYLEIERKGDAAAKMKNTAVNSPRDLHDDQKNPPTKESIIGEVQLQCSSLFFQTKIDDEKLFRQTMRFFMSDLLKWYGGRDKNIPFDEVEMYALPIVMSLSRYQIESVVDIMKVCDQYVVKLRRIEDFSEEEKEKAVEEGFSAFIKAQHHTGEQMQEFAESGSEAVLTAHERGTINEGYIRLMQAMVTLYKETTPAKTIRQLFNAYVEGLPNITDEQIEKAVNRPRCEPVTAPKVCEPVDESTTVEAIQSDVDDGNNQNIKDEKSEKEGFLKRMFKYN